MIVEKESSGYLADLTFDKSDEGVSNETIGELKSRGQNMQEKKQTAKKQTREQTAKKQTGTDGQEANRKANGQITNKKASYNAHWKVECIFRSKIAELITTDLPKY